MGFEFFADSCSELLHSPVLTLGDNVWLAIKNSGVIHGQLFLIDDLLFGELRLEPFGIIATQFKLFLLIPLSGPFIVPSGRNCKQPGRCQVLFGHSFHPDMERLIREKICCGYFILAVGILCNRLNHFVVKANPVFVFGFSVLNYGQFHWNIDTIEFYICFFQNSFRKSCRCLTAVDYLHINNSGDH